MCQPIRSPFCITPNFIQIQSVRLKIKANRQYSKQFSLVALTCVSGITCCLQSTPRCFRIWSILKAKAYLGLMIFLLISPYVHHHTIFYVPIVLLHSLLLFSYENNINILHQVKGKSLVVFAGWDHKLYFLIGPVRNMLSAISDIFLDMTVIESNVFL